jgi:hypothetical protein
MERTINKEGKELKREKSLNTRVIISPVGRLKESRDSFLQIGVELRL